MALILRQISPTGVPDSACRKANAICSSENRFFGIWILLSLRENTQKFALQLDQFTGSRPRAQARLQRAFGYVPVGNESSWTADPKGEERDGKLYGLGVSDMKGGLAAIIFALRHLAAIRHRIAGEIVATFAGDEETMGTEGTGYLLQEVPAASGDAMISADTGSPHVLRFGEKGTIWLQLDATGRSAHAAHVHKGENAIEKLMQVMTELTVLRNCLVHAPSEVLGAIAEASERSESLSGAGETKVLQQVTITFGTISGGRLSNLIADQATATADIRLPVGSSVAEVEAQIEAILARNSGVSMSITRRYEPSWTHPKHEIIQLLRENCGRRLGTCPVVNMRVGASDARHYRRAGIPTVVCGLTSHNMGGADEYVETDELTALGEIFALTAFDYLNGKQGR